MSICNLPNEIWQEILINLSFVDLMNARQVCQDFRTLSTGEYFMKYYPYAEVIEKACKWRKLDDGYKINTRNNSLIIHLMGLCMQHYDFELFNRLLKKVRTKKKGFRMNWIDIYYYAGLGGNIKSFEFLKDINSYRTSHGESCMRGALHGANLELTKYLKEKNKIRIPLYYNSVNKLINDNAVEFIKYLYNLNHEELIRYVDPYQAIRPLIKHRSAELIKLLIHINRDYIKNHILRIVGCDKETIEWLISNEIMDLNNGSEYMRLLQSSSFTTTLIYYIENGFVDKKDVDWDDILSRVLSYRYGRERKLKILLEFIIDDLDNRTINNLIALSSQYQFMTKLIIILNNLGTTVNSKSLLDYIFANGIRMHYDDIRDIYTTIDFSNLT